MPKDNALNKYLDKQGLEIVWGKVKDKVAEETAAREAADTEIRVELNAELAKKVDRTLTSDSGKAEIFNEIDGGGAKFTHKDGTESFVGVNNGGENGLAAQIYADKLNDAGKWEGAKLDVTNGGMYYTVGDKSFAERAIADNELAVKGDLKAENVSFVPVSGKKPMVSTDVQSAIEETWQAIETGGTGSVVTLEKAASADDGYFATYIIKQGGNAVSGGVQGKINIPKDFLVKSASIKLGSECVPVQEPQDHKFIDFVINVKEGSAEDQHLFLDVEELAQVYTAGAGIIIESDNSITYDPDVLSTVDYVDQSITNTITYFTQELNNEHEGRVAGDNLLQAAIDAEATRAKAEEAKKVDRAITGDKGTAEIFNERDGGGAKFTGTETAFVGVHDSIGGEIGVQAYVDNAAGTESTIIDITQNGAYYTKGELKSGSDRDIPENEIATIKDVLEHEPASISAEEIEDICK